MKCPAVAHSVAASRSNSAPSDASENAEVLAQQIFRPDPHGDRGVAGRCGRPRSPACPRPGRAEMRRREATRTRGRTLRDSASPSAAPARGSGFADESGIADERQHRRRSIDSLECGAWRAWEALQSRSRQCSSSLVEFVHLPDALGELCSRPLEALAHRCTDSVIGTRP